MTINEEDIKRVYSETIFERGLDYFVEGRVTDVIKFKNKLTGEVEGSAKYKTEVDLSDLHSRCSCPYDVNCKHGAAMLLQYLDGGYTDGDEAAKKLDGMSREELRTVLDTLMSMNPSNLLYLNVHPNDEEKPGDIRIEALDKNIESRLDRVKYSNADEAFASDFARFIKANETVLTKEQIYHIIEFLIDNCEDYGWFYDDYSDDYFGDAIFENLCDAFVKKQLEEGDFETLKDLKQRDGYDMLKPFFRRLPEVENTVNLKEFEESVRDFLDENSYVEFLIKCGLTEKARLMIESLDLLGEENRFRLYMRIDEGAAMEFASRIGAISSLINYYYEKGAHDEVVRLFMESVKDETRKWSLNESEYIYNEIFDSINKSEENNDPDEVLRALFEKCFSAQYYGLCADVGFKLDDEKLLRDLIDKRSGYKFDLDKKLKVLEYLKDDYGEEVVRELKSLASSLIDLMKNNSYQKAAECVFLLRNIMGEDKWKEYVIGLYKEHSGKRNLWKRFNSKGIYLKKKKDEITFDEK